MLGRRVFVRLLHARFRQRADVLSGRGAHRVPERCQPVPVGRQGVCQSRYVGVFPDGDTTPFLDLFDKETDLAEWTRMLDDVERQEQSAQLLPVADDSRILRQLFELVVAVCGNDCRVESIKGVAEVVLLI